MRAISISDYGRKPEIVDIPAPVPGPDQVLIQQKATSLNPVDPGRASGALKHVFPLKFPFIPGGEIVGTVLALGSNVSGVQVGQEVVGFNGVGGGYAEQAVVDANRLAVRPENVSVKDAAASLLVGRTAIQALELLKLKAGQTLLIQGGAGGVGIMAIQLAHKAGARVIVTAKPAQSERLKALGAAEVIDRDSDLPSQVAEVDALLDLVGGSVLASAYTLVKLGGTLITTNQPPDKAQTEARQLTAQQVISDCTAEGIRDVLARLNSGELKAVIEAEQSLWDIESLWTRPQAENAVGKVVYTVATP